MLRSEFIQMLGAIPALSFLRLGSATAIQDTPPTVAISSVAAEGSSLPLDAFLDRFSVIRADLEEESNWFDKFVDFDGKEEIAKIAQNPAKCFPLITEHLERLFKQAAEFQRNINEFNERLENDPVCQKLYDIELHRQHGLLEVRARAWCRTRNSTVDSDFASKCEAVAEGKIPEELMKDGKPCIKEMRDLRSQLECGSDIDLDADELKKWVEIKTSTSAERKAIGEQHFWHRHIFRDPADDYDEKIEYSSCALQHLAESISGMRTHILQQVARLYVKHAHLTETNFPILQEEYWQDRALPSLSSFLREAAAVMQGSDKPRAEILTNLPPPQKRSALPERSERNFTGVEFAFNPEKAWTERAAVVANPILRK